MTSHIETEVKLYAPDLMQAESGLIALGAKLVAPRVYERNVRYEDAAGSMTGRGVVLRLRQDSRARLTYKEPILQADDDLSARFEAEVTVDDFDTMALILERLGYAPFAIYEKYRTTYQYDGTEIVLDEMPYGNFIEIEGQPDAIRLAISALGLDDVPRFTSNYLAMFERVKAALSVDFRDLTFANFEGVDVPLSAFE